MGLVTLCFSTRLACRAKKFIGRRAFLFLYETAGGAPPAERAAQCGSSRFKTHYFSLVQFLDALSSCHLCRRTTPGALILNHLSVAKTTEKS